MVARNGFIVPNAATAGAHLDLAEPDALDFSILGNLRYGVLRGCNLALSGWNVTVGTGVVVNNGTVLTTGGQVGLDTAGQDARFDLVGVNSSGTITKVVGDASPNPVFPDFDENFVVLASVMVRPGMTPPLASDLTDKRVIVPERFVTALDLGTLLGSYHPTTMAPKYTVEHDGKTTWGGDTRMYRTGSGVVKIEDRLDLGNLTVSNDATVGHNLAVTGLATAANLRRGAGGPSGTVPLGSLHQDTLTGNVWAYTQIGWEQMSTVPIPAGMVMSSLLSSEPAGWLFLNGQQVDETRAGGLWSAFPSWQISTSGGPRLQLPDYTGMFLRQGIPGQTGGAATLTLTTDNLPAHKHMGDGTQQMQPAGAHTHTATSGIVGPHDHSTIPGTPGTHSHDVSDPGHKHNGAEGGAGGAFIAAIWNGRRRIDGPFNDASHPVAVQEVASTVRATTGLTVATGGGHWHWTDLRGQHSHNIFIDASGASHTHILNEQSVGASKPLDNLPPFAGVRYLIKI